MGLLSSAPVLYLPSVGGNGASDAEVERLRDLLAFNGIDPDAMVESAKGAASAYVRR